MGYQANGFVSEFPWVGDKIVVWDKDTKDIIWEWSTFDYYSMNDYDTISDTWFQAATLGRFDWTHSNALDYDWSLDTNSIEKIYLSVRHLSRISKIDYNTKNIEWNIGLEMPSGDTTLGNEIKFSFQHSIHKSNLYPSCFATLDNGNISELLHENDFPFSRVIEVDVLEDNSCDIVWEYTLPEDLFGPFHGSAQKLNNGNYLINTAGMFNTGNHGGTIIEVTNSQEIVSITTTETEWGGNVYSYRAYRIPSIHPNAFSLIIDDLFIE